MSDRFEVFVKEKRFDRCFCGFRFRENSQPYYLNCFHSICLRCIHLDKFRQSILCPKCGQTTSVSAKNNLPRDIMDFDIDITYDNSVFNCIYCSCLPSYQCKTCSKYVCRICIERHRRGNNMLQIYTISRLMLKELLQKQKCDVHKYNPVKYTCNDCKIYLCIICKTRHDGDHDIEDVFVSDKVKYTKIRFLRFLVKVVSEYRLRIGTDIEHVEETAVMIEKYQRSSLNDNLFQELESLKDFKIRLENASNIMMQNLFYNARFSEDDAVSLLSLILEIEHSKSYSHNLSLERIVVLDEIGEIKKEQNILNSLDDNTDSSSCLSDCKSNENSRNEVSMKKKVFKHKISKITIYCDIEEFPSVVYLLGQANFAIKHMDGVLDNITQAINSEIHQCLPIKGMMEDLSGERSEDLKTLLHEVREAAFVRQKICLRILSDESVLVIKESLQTSSANVTEYEPTYEKEEVFERTDMCTVNVCWLANVETGYFESEVTKFFRSLSRKDLNHVIFVQNKHDKEENVLQKIFDYNFYFKKNPIYTTSEELRKTISLVILDNIFEILDVLKNVFEKCLDNLTKLRERDYDKIVEIDRDDQVKIFKEGIRDVRSLLQEKPEGENLEVKLPSVPENVYQDLKVLKDEGAKACCLFDGELFVFVDRNAQNFDRLVGRIKDITNENVSSCIIIRCEWPLFKPLICNGWKLYPGRLLENNKRDKYGTLGSFAMADEIGLVGITSGHVAYKTEEIFISDNETRDKKLLGTCIVGSEAGKGRPTDISVIKLHEEITERCRQLFVAEDRKSYSLKLFTKGKSNIKENQRVHKIGASSDYTCGTISSDLQTFHDMFGTSNILVEGMHGKPFAVGGDSGSLVYMRNLSDDMQASLNVLSMVVGGEIELTDDITHVIGQSTTTSTKEEIAKRLANCTVTVLLQEAFQSVGDAINLKLIHK